MSLGQFLQYLIVAVVSGSILLVGLWWNEPLPIHYVERRIVTPFVKIGDTLVIHVTAFYLKRSCLMYVDRYIYDSTGKEHKFELAPRPRESSYEVHITVPHGVAPGPAKYIAEIHWSCNPVQYLFPRALTQEALPFEVDPGENDAPVVGRQGYLYTYPDSNVSVSGGSRLVRRNPQPGQRGGVLWRSRLPTYFGWESPRDER